MLGHQGWYINHFFLSLLAAENLFKKLLYIEPSLSLGTVHVYEGTEFAPI